MPAGKGRSVGYGPSLLLLPPTPSPNPWTTTPSPSLWCGKKGFVGEGVRDEEDAVGGSVKYWPPPDNGLGALAAKSRGGISRAGGACLLADPDPLPEETLDGPAKGRELLLALELELGSERPRGEDPASGDLAVGLVDGIESCEGRGTAREPVARLGGRQTWSPSELRGMGAEQDEQVTVGSMTDARSVGRGIVSDMPTYLLKRE
jgi:hypothetical protein